jgi:hypothetical protein
VLEMILVHLPGYVRSNEGAISISTLTLLYVMFALMGGVCVINYVLYYRRILSPGSKSCCCTGHGDKVTPRPRALLRIVS